MTNVKSTKRALVSSILALFLCFAMLLGTTYAWFTDSVSSDNNIIKSGTLDVTMEYAEGKEDPATTEWKDASKGAIFDYENWEPGYTSAKHIKISNVGTLALNYQLRIVANGVVSKLADVIDVYVIAGEDVKALERSDLDGVEPIGTLTEVLGTDKNLAKTVKGSIIAGEEADVYTLVLKMKEEADNKYQNMDLGCTFSVQLMATQMSAESDAFGKDYDEVVPDENIPAALVRSLDDLNVTYRLGLNGQAGQEMTLDAGYKFEPTISYQDAQNSLYRYWHADFVVYADSSVPANSMALAGYYDAWCSAIGGDWIALTADTDIPANTEIRLVESIGATVNWEEICQFGNDDKGFQCGAVDLTGANAGTTLTVELRLYETTKAWDAPSGTANDETGNYMTVGKFEYTFGGNYVTLEDNTVLFYADDGEVVLYDISDVETDNYYVPVGVTTLNSGVFAQNADIKTVNVSKTVTDFGATGVSETSASSGAFKGSAVETVVLPEGMTEIPAAAFNGAKNLKSVNIPASVETIGVNAFRQTALETLTVPATVKTISNGAFRDMASLTTVTIEGDVAFANYAFRSVPNLTSIYLLGENVTINGGQFACHSDNGDANGITIYVKYAAVAACVYAAQTSTYGYEVKVLGSAADGSDAGEVTNASNDAQLADAIANGAAVVVLSDGTYTFPANNLQPGMTLICDEGTVFDGKTGLNINGATVVGATFTNNNDYLVNSTTINGTFKDCVFTDCDGLRYCYAGDTVVFENCVFDTDFYGVHFDGGANEVLFKNCTFTGFNTFGSAVTKLTLENCTFDYNGKGGYCGINLWGNSELIDCTFVFDGSATEWVDLCSSNQTVTFTNCVVTDGTTETPIKDVVGNYGDGNTIIIDGVTVDIPNMS